MHYTRLVFFFFLFLIYDKTKVAKEKKKTHYMLLTVVNPASELGFISFSEDRESTKAEPGHMKTWQDNMPQPPRAGER